MKRRSGVSGKSRLRGMTTDKRCPKDDCRAVLHGPKPSEGRVRNTTKQCKCCGELGCTTCMAINPRSGQWLHKDCLEKQWRKSLAVDMAFDPLFEPPDWAWYGSG